MAAEEPVLSENTNKYVTFEDNIRKLFTSCDNVKKAISARKPIPKKHPIYDGFKQFMNTYEEIGAEDTMVLFEDFYMKKRYQILSKKETWIGSSSKATIEYPSRNKTKRRKAIFLSFFYQNALDLAREAEKEVTEFNRDEEAANVYLPEEIIFPLLEIFSLIAPLEDMEKLNIYREEIKADLPDTDIRPNTNPNPMAGMGNLGTMLNTALEGIDLSNISQAIGGMSQEGGNGAPMMPPDMDIGETISGLFNNPESKKVINKVSGKFKDMKDIGDLKEVVGGLLSDKDLQDTVKGLIPEPVTDSEANKMISDAKREHPDVVNIDSEMIISESISQSSQPIETTIVSNPEIIGSSADTPTTSVIHLDTPSNVSPIPQENME